MTNEEEEPSLQIIREPVSDETVLIYKKMEPEPKPPSPVKVDVVHDVVETVAPTGGELEFDDPEELKNDLPIIEEVIDKIQAAPPVQVTDTVTEKNEHEVKKNRTIGQIHVALKRNIPRGKVAFSSSGRKDGVGAQALAKITTNVMAEALNQKYAHTPFEFLEHCDPGAKQTQFRQDWEALLQICGKSELIQRYPHIHAHNDAAVSVVSPSFVDGHCYTFRDCHSFTETYRDSLEAAWKTVIEGLRVRYHAGTEAKPLVSPILVAVHIRRGDVTETSQTTASRWLPEKYYIDVMQRLEQNNPNQSFIFDILSEGQESDFQIFADTFGDRVRFHLAPPNTNLRLQRQRVNQQQQRQFGRQLQVGRGLARNQHLLNRRGVITEPFNRSAQSQQTGPTAAESFKALVAADILIMSRSAFSFVAGLYSRGMKIVPPGMLWSIPVWCEKHDFWYYDDCFPYHLTTCDDNYFSMFDDSEVPEIEQSETEIEFDDPLELNDDNCEIASEA